MRKKHPIENMMDLPSFGPRISVVRGQSVFPVTKDADEVVIFVEYNGYRKEVRFPVESARSAARLPLKHEQEKKRGK